MNKSITVRTICLLLNFGLIITLFSSCKTSQKTVDSKDLSYLYNPTKNSFSPGYNIINQSDELSVLSVRFLTSDLFFTEANPQGIPTAMILITVKLFNTTMGRNLADTAVYNLNIIREEGRSEYIYNVPLNVEKGIEYMAEIKILDRLRLQVVQAFVPFNTLSYNNKYNFRAQGHFDKNELFNHVLRVNEYVNLVYSRMPIDSLFISYYRPLHEIPDPPSMMLPEKTIDYQPGQVVAIPYSDTIPIMFPREGIYLCSAGRDIKEGYTFHEFWPFIFPSLTTPEVMIEPLAYLASQDEVANLRSANKPKVALDDFWIGAEGILKKPGN